MAFGGAVAGDIVEMDGVETEGAVVPVGGTGAFAHDEGAAVAAPEVLVKGFGMLLQGYRTNVFFRQEQVVPAKGRRFIGASAWKGRRP